MSKQTPDPVPVRAGRKDALPGPSRPYEAVRAKVAAGFLGARSLAVAEEGRSS